jgi:predicted RNase H-like HicB family nuclease
MKLYKTIKMIATIEGDDENGYTAYLGDVISEGDTAEEAIENLENALYGVLNCEQ